MAECLPADTDYTHNYAIQGKPNELTFLDQIQHPFTCDASDDKGRQETYQH